MDKVFADIQSINISYRNIVQAEQLAIQAALQKRCSPLGWTHAQTALHPLRTLWWPLSVAYQIQGAYREWPEWHTRASLHGIRAAKRRAGAIKSRGVFRDAKKYWACVEDPLAVRELCERLTVEWLPAASMAIMAIEHGVEGPEEDTSLHRLFAPCPSRARQPEYYCGVCGHWWNNKEWKQRCVRCNVPVDNLCTLIGWRNDSGQFCNEATIPF